MKKPTKADKQLAEEICDLLAKRASDTLTDSTVHYTSLDYSKLSRAMVLELIVKAKK